MKDKYNHKISTMGDMDFNIPQENQFDEDDKLLPPVADTHIVTYLYSCQKDNDHTNSASSRPENVCSWGRSKIWWHDIL